MDTSQDSTISFREMIASDRFCYGAEVVTTRGIARPEPSDRIVAMANGLLDDSRIAWISITDNPGGGPMLPPDWLAGVIAEKREKVVLHLTCKDMSRNGLESCAWRYAAEGFNNILALTGDYPTTGFGGLSGPVFDLDAVGLIALLKAMNDGLDVPGRRGKMETLPKTNFFIGCAVSPFKRHERELVPQYFKLLRKIQAGAQWVVPQLGYDMRKFHEIKLLLDSKNVSVPLVGNVYLLTKGVARLFNSGKLAGCVVSDDLLNVASRYAAGEDKGRKFFREFAAKQLAVFKGLGFAAGYIGGITKPDTFFEVIDMAENFAEDDWRDFIKEIQYPLPDEFFFFDHSNLTGMSEPTAVNREYVKSLESPPKSKEVTLAYRISRLFHDWMFTRDKGIWNLMVKLYSRLDKKPDGIPSRVLYALERQAKLAGFDCRDCGDCSLPECGYLCPKSACSKNMRNGPCGGSFDGRCELDDKECIWARTYERLKHFGETDQLLEGPTVFYNAELEGTSSWANTFLSRDHSVAKDSETE